MDNNNTPGPSKPNDLNNLLPRGLLGRKGVPIGQSTRLPSLGRPRDLTLGGTTKRQYSPNIPVRKERGDAQVSTERGRGVTTRGNRGGDSGRGAGRGRARTRGGRGRGGQVQTVGSIFSEGIAEKDLRKTSFGGESSRDSKDYVPRPSVNFKADVKVNKEHEKQKLREILQDNFIDDDDDSFDDDSKDVPITLPLCPHMADKKSKTALKKEVKIKKAIVKEEKMDISIDGADDKKSATINELHSSVRIKSEPLDFDDDQDSNVSGMIKSKGSSMIKEEKDDSEETLDDEDFSDLSCSKLLLSIQEMEQEETLLFHFPDCLPLLRQSSEDEKPNIKQEPGVGFGAVPDPQRPSTSSAPQNVADVSDEGKGNSISDIPEGYVGKLQVLKSGKTRLVIGSVTMNVELGADVGYLQDIVSLRTSGNSGSLTVLGHPRNRLVCVPEMRNMYD